MAVKVMSLRRNDACSVCSVELSAGSRAQWDSGERKVTCLVCVDGAEVSAPGPIEVDGDPAADTPAEGAPGEPVTKPPRVMSLRRDGKCSVCSVELPARSRAQWDSGERKLTCLSCVENAAQPAQLADSAPSAPTTDSPPESDAASLTTPPDHAEAPPTELTTETRPAEEPDWSTQAEAPPIDVGVAGASARKEFERRRAKREQQIEDKWGSGRMGRIVKFWSDDPQSTTAWAQGARGEEVLASVLSERLGERAVLLHDRKVPRTRGNIDHIAIAASGVWIIDTKRYRGKVERRDVGGFFRSDVRLYVGGRDRTKAVAGLGWQIDAVRAVIDDESIPVHPTLSFVGADWPLFFAKPFRLNDVWVSWPAKLAELVLEDGPLGPDDVERVARQLAERLPAIRA